MPPIPDWLLHPFALGLYPGLLLALYLRIQLSLARRDLRSKERSQISQISALTETLQKLRDETKSLETERENLRVKIQSLSQKPEHQRLRHLEILLRAEQRLTVTAPGFAPAWQTAKNEALSELESEERGKSMPRQVLAQLLNSGAAALEKLRPTATLQASGSGPEESGPKA